MPGSVHVRKKTTGEPEGVLIRTKAASGGSGCWQVLDIDRRRDQRGQYPGAGAHDQLQKL
ncbi:MAG TPA: hypothetical protein DHV79_00570 [Lachnospiraceae bacterium]|nr:hypothetical protein [Lachnospiraceae bacterium]